MFCLHDTTEVHRREITEKLRNGRNLKIHPFDKEKSSSEDGILKQVERFHHIKHT